MPIDQQIEPLIPHLRRYARSLLHNAVHADDLVQDCLLRALEKQHQLQPDSNLRAWLFTLMHNLYVNQIRQLTRQPDTYCWSDESSSDNDPEPELLARHQQLQQQMSQIPFAQREVLALVVLEGFSYQQVANILAVPIGTVMSRLNRARETLREKLYSDPGQPLRRVK